MADNAEVLKKLERRPNVSYPVLVPNISGFEKAMEVGVQEIAIFVSASEAFR